jgi:hypothetical protein
MQNNMAAEWQLYLVFGFMAIINGPLALDKLNLV